MADVAIGLNARVGRTSPQPWLQAANDTNMAHAEGSARGSMLAFLDTRIARVPAVAMLFALVIALWPHWWWMAHRLTDGSDEPWGILALVTVLVLIGRDWRRLAVPVHGALLASGSLAIVAGLARGWLPPLGAAAIAMGALATFIGAARRDRSAAPLTTLLLLTLPVIASLQFYFGYPLRLATAALAAPVLNALGFDVQSTGAALAYAGGLVLVDPPCAGIGMLWVGAYTAALLSYLNKASVHRTLAAGTVAASSVFVANVARNVALFFPEALELGWPAWAHAAIGLIAFGCALLPIVWFAQPAAPRKRSGWPAWPHRYHRRIA